MIVINVLNQFRPHFYERDFLNKILETTGTEKENNIKISEENRNAFIKAMKIGYYKEFHKQGLITDNQLEMLIALQDDPDLISKKTA